MLGLRIGIGQRPTAKRNAQTIGMAITEGGNLLLVLPGEYGTGHEQHFATGRQHLPQRVENVATLRGELPQVRLATQPLDVRVPACYAGGRARNIGQDALEGAAVPPAVHGPAVGYPYLRRQAEPRKIGVDSGSAGGIAFERGQIDVGQFENVGCLATGGGASIQYALPGGNIQPRCRMLRTGILHRNATVGEAGQTGDRNRLLEQKTARDVVAVRSSADARRIEFRQYAADIGSASIDSQGHRRVGIAGSEHGFGMSCQLAPNRFHPPSGMTSMGDQVRIGSFNKGVGLTQEIAQHCVNQALEAAAMQCERRLDRLINRRVGSGRMTFEPVQGDQQQCANRGRFKWPGKQSRQEEITAAEFAQRSVGKMLHGASGRRRPRCGSGLRRQSLIEVAAMDHHLHCTRGEQHGKGQRIGGRPRRAHRRTGRARPVVQSIWMTALIF